MSAQDPLNLEDLEDRLIWVDHRGEEDAILEQIAEQLDDPDALVTSWKESEQLWISYRGQDHFVPLTMSPVDRYVAISSVAAVLGDDYDIYLKNDSLDGDTHALLVLNKSTLRGCSSNVLGEFTALYSKLELGVDYFGNIRIPYVGNENNNPNCKAQAQAQVERSHDLADAVLRSADGQQAMSAMRQGIGDIQAQAVRRYLWKSAGKVFLYAFAIFLVIRVLPSVIERL